MTTRKYTLISLSETRRAESGQCIWSRLEENKDSLSETIFQDPFEKYNLNKEGIAGQNIAEAKYICF